MAAAYLLSACSPSGYAEAWSVLALSLPGLVAPPAALSAHADGSLHVWAALPSGSAKDVTTSNGTGVAHAASAGVAGVGVGFLSSATTAEGQLRVLSAALDGSVALWEVDVEALAERVAAAIAEEKQGVTAEENINAVATSENEASSLLHAVAAAASIRKPFADGTAGFEAYAVALHPSGTLFAAAGSSGVGIFSASDEDGSFGTPVRRCAAPAQSGSSKGKGRAVHSEGMGTSIAFSSNGELVASGTDAGQVHIHSVATGEHLSTFSDHALPIRSLSFSGDGPSPDAHHLLVSSEDRTLTLHDVRGLVRASSGSTGRIGAGATVACLRHPGWPTSASQALSGAGLLATSCTDGAVRLYDTRGTPRTCVATLREGAGRVWCVTRAQAAAVDEGGAAAVRAAMLLSANEDGSVRWYRAAGTGLDVVDA